jgi:hypothetical protein
MKKLVLFLVFMVFLGGCLLENGVVVDETTDAGVDASANNCTVTIQATDSEANEAGDTATIVFKRENCLFDRLLEVKFDLGGTANSSDYVGLSDWYVLIPVGQNQATVVVTPVDDTVIEGLETLIFAIRAEPHIVVGVPNTATVTIGDNDVSTSPPNFTVTADSPTVSAGTCTNVRLDIISNITNCVAIGGVSGDGWAGVTATVDTVRQVCPTGTTTYGWRCTGTGGTRDQSSTVTVNSQCTGNGTLVANTLFVVVGNPIDLDATFNCPSSTIARVDFKVGSTILCTDTSAPYHCDWDNATVGTHVVIATAYSSSGVQLLQTNTLQIEVAQTSQQVSCHGLGLYFSTTQVNSITRCMKWSAAGFGTDIAKSTFVDGGVGACALTCYDSTGNTVRPLAVTGVWLQNGTSDVPRWYTTGCARLPWHPANEPDQAGGAWDKLCDRSVDILSGPPNTNQ